MHIHIFNLNISFEKYSNYDIIIYLKFYLFSHFSAANYSLIFSSCNNYSFYRELWGGY